MLGKKYKKERPLIIYGNCSRNNTFGGGVSTPNSTIKKKLSKKSKLIEQDEFRTSQVCCSCFQRMKGFKYAKAEKAEKESYSVRHCTNDQCNRMVWDRDTNASINILRKFLFVNRDLELPTIFLRGEPGYIFFFTFYLLFLFIV